MTDLSREEIMEYRRGASYDPEDRRLTHGVCDMALRTHDAEADRDNYRAKFHDVETRAQRAEAECERLRDMLNRIASGPRRDSVTQCQMAAEALATPSPEGSEIDYWSRGHSGAKRHAEQTGDGPQLCPTCRQSDQPLAIYYICDGCERAWKEVENGHTDNPYAEPNVVETPEQAHGDALAALERIEQGAVQLRDTPAKTFCGPQPEDFAIVRRHLTASGVPYVPENAPAAFVDWLVHEMPPGTTIGDPGWWAPRIWRKVRYALGSEPMNSGVPYVPESIRKLPGRWDRYALTMENVDKGRGLVLAAYELKTALASAPADGYKLVPVEPTRDMLIDGAKAVRDWLSEDGPYPRSRAMWRAMIAAAPSDGE